MPPLPLLYSCLFALTGGIEEKDEHDKEATMMIVTPMMKTTAKERRREERRIKFGDRTKMEVKVEGEGGE